MSNLLKDRYISAISRKKRMILFYTSFSTCTQLKSFSMVEKSVLKLDFEIFWYSLKNYTQIWYGEFNFYVFKAKIPPNNIKPSKM